jgi:hypothetical protein
VPVIRLFHRINHSAVTNADWLPDETPLRSLCPKMVSTACGLVGAGVAFGARIRGIVDE